MIGKQIIGKNIHFVVLQKNISILLRIGIGREYKQSYFWSKIDEPRDKKEREKSCHFLEGDSGNRRGSYPDMLRFEIIRKGFQMRYHLFTINDSFTVWKRVIVCKTVYVSERKMVVCAMKRKKVAKKEQL